MPSKVFISWSGDLSKELAEEIRVWLPGVLQFVKPYFTPNDIEKGARWSSEIAKELDSSDVGIICLTKDNLNNPWVLFEAGALSKNLDKANVCTILFNLDSSDFTGPLTNFQATKFIKADFKKLITTINNTAGESKLDPPILNDVFEMWWPKLDVKITQILKKSLVEPKGTPRSDRDILEEVLELTRLNLKRSPRRNELSRESILRLMETLQEVQFRLLKVGNKESRMLLEELSMPIHRLCMEFDMPELFERYMARTEQFLLMEKDEARNK